MNPKSRLHVVKISYFFTIVAAIAPKTAGIESKNEYLKTFSLFIFLNRHVEIVKPLLEIPGIVATPCAMPTSREST